MKRLALPTGQVNPSIDAMHIMLVARAVRLAFDRNMLVLQLKMDAMGSMQPATVALVAEVAPQGMTNTYL